MNQIIDSISKSESEDISGLILTDGFKDVGCIVDHQCILPDGSKKLLSNKILE